MLVEQSKSGVEDVREREVAEEDLDDKDNSQWEHLFCGVVVEFEKATTCDTTRAVGQPAQEASDARFGVDAPEGATLGCDWNSWRNSSCKSKSSQGTTEAPCQAREADEQDVCENELDICASQREGESACISTPC